MAKQEWILGRSEHTHDVEEWILGQSAVSVDGTEAAAGAPVPARIYGEIDLPSSMTGFARNKSESAYPEYWDGLVGYWDFSVQGTIPRLGLARDLSGNINHGTLQNDTRSVAGKFGPALDLDGTGDNVTAPLVALSGPTTWVVRSYTPALRQQWLLTADVLGSAWGIGCADTNGTLRAYSGTGTGSRWVGNAGNFVAGKWQHWAVVHDGDHIANVYRDSVPLVPASNNSTSVIGAGTELRIGGENGFWTWWLGQVDHVLIYNRALSASEIKFLYGKPKALVTPRYRLVSVAGEVTPPTSDIVVLRRRIEAA